MSLNLYDLEPKIQDKVTYNIQKAKLIKDERILKKLNKNIWEFKTRVGYQEIRLLAFWDLTRNSIMIVTHGFFKKTQKTPKIQIEKAEQFRLNYYKFKNFKL